MSLDTSTWLLVGAGAGLLVAIAIVAIVWLRERRRIGEWSDYLEGADPDDEVHLDPPDVSSSILGLVATWRHNAKAKRLARKGYVRWYKIGASMSRPQWVKPEARGAGELEHYDGDEGVTYLFPTDAMVTDARTGAYVAVHRQGEAEPINLADPAMPPIPTDRLEEVINLEAESDAPGFFDRFDLDAKTLMWLSIGLVFVVGAAQQFMGGG